MAKKHALSAVPAALALSQGAQQGNSVLNLDAAVSAVTSVVVKSLVACDKATSAVKSADATMLSVCKGIRANYPNDEEFKAVVVASFGTGVVVDGTPYVEGTIAVALRAEKFKTDPKQTLNRARNICNALALPNFSTLNGKGKQMAFQALAKAARKALNPQATETSAEVTDSFDSSPANLAALAKAINESGAMGEFLIAVSKEIDDEFSGIAKAISESADQLIEATAE